MTNVVIDNKIVKKSDALIKARYSLNPIALKFITTIIANLKISDETDKEYVFKVIDFANLIGVDYANFYKEMEEAVEELLRKPLHIPKETGWLKINWISSAEYVEKAGMITFRIDPKLRPYLLEIKNRYLRYNLENILPIRSSYSIRMYEILKDWYNTFSRYNKKAEKIVDIEWIRKTLRIPDSYNFGRIKKNVILKSQEDIKKYTDIYFDFEEIKTARKVTHIKFTIHSKNPINKDMQSLPKQESPLKQEKEPMKPKSPNKTLSPLEQLKSEVKNGLPYIQFKRKLMHIQNVNIANYLEDYQPYILVRTDSIGHLELYNQKTKETITLDAIKDQERLENLRKYLYKNPDRIGDVKEINEEEMILNDLKSKLLNRYDTFKLKNGLHYCVQIKSIKLKDDKVKITGDDIIEGIKDMSITWDLKDIDKYITGLKDSVDRDLIEHYKILNISTKKNIIKEKIEQLNIHKLLEVAEFLDNKSLELSKKYIEYEKENNQEKMKEIRKKVEALNEATFNLVDFTEGSIEEINLDLFIKEPVFRLICNQVK